MAKSKIKPAERIVELLRILGKEHSEMSLGFHIIMATEGSSLDTLSDKEFLYYLETYQGSLSLEEQIEDDVELDPLYRSLPLYEDDDSECEDYNYEENQYGN